MLSDYNKHHNEDFFLKTYTPQKDFKYFITFGPAIINTDKPHFRIAIYREEINPEENRNFSLIRGVSYRYWSREDLTLANADNSDYNFRKQYFSIIPIGFKIQSKSKSFKPYGYLGVGMFVGIETDHKIENSVDMGNVNNFFGFFTFNIGAGVSFRVRSSFVLIEITPSFFEGPLLNAGIRF